MTAPTIAILDNDPSFLSVIHDLLAAAGYRTLRCRPRDVRDVHALVKRFQPALVILGRWWRSGDGWEFLKNVWTDSATTHVGVVLTCGQMVVPSLQGEILDAMRCQLVRIPLDQHEVLRAIETVLGPSSARRILGRRVAALPTTPPVTTKRVLDSRTPAQLSSDQRRVLKVAHCGEDRAHEALHRHAMDERAALRASYALEAASDS